MLDSFYKLNCFSVNTFSLYCFHYVVISYYIVTFVDCVDFHDFAIDKNAS